MKKEQKSGAASQSLPTPEHSEQLQNTDSERLSPVGPYLLQFPTNDEHGHAEGTGESPSDDSHDNNILAVDPVSPKSRINSPSAAAAAAATAAPYAYGELTVGTLKSGEEVASRCQIGDSDFTGGVTVDDTERVMDDEQRAATPASCKNRDDDDDRETVGSVQTVGLEDSGTDVELGDAGNLDQVEIAEAMVVVDGIGNGGDASDVHSVGLASGSLGERERNEKAGNELVICSGGWGVPERLTGDGDDHCGSSKHASGSRDESGNHDRDDNNSECPITRNHDDDERIRLMAEDTDAEGSFRGEDFEKMSLASPSMPGLLAMPRSFSAIGSTTSPTDNSRAFSVAGLDWPDGSLYAPSPIALLHGYRRGWDVDSTGSPCPPYQDVTSSARNSVKSESELVVDENMPPPRVPSQRPPRPPPLPPRPVAAAPTVSQTFGSGDRVIGSNDSDAGSVFALDNGIIGVGDAPGGEELRSTGDDRVDLSTNRDEKKEPWQSLDGGGGTRPSSLSPADEAVSCAHQWNGTE